MVLNKQEKKRLPSTLARSPEKAQDTYMHTLEAAEKVHGDGEAAHRIAFGSLKHSFEKVGDHWRRRMSGVRVMLRMPSGGPTRWTAIRRLRVG